MRQLPRKKSRLLLGGCAVVLAASVVYAVSVPGRATANVGSFVRDGSAGFVVTHFAYAVGPDANKAGSCPDGMSKNVAEIYALTPEGQRRRDEGDEEYGKRVEAGGQRLSATPDGRNYCMHPELANRDPHTRIMKSADVAVEGMNLDDKVSRSRADVASGRLDFRGVDGTKGVDNQYWRAVGCNRSFQSDGQSNSFEITMYTGSWGILVNLDGVDDIKNDDHVDVQIVANADPMRLSPSREALEYATYSMDPDERFRATTTGRIENGVLKTDPVDIRLHQDVNAMYLERSMRDAQIHATLSSSGVLKGYLGGYVDVEELYDFQFGFRNGKNIDGTPAPMGRKLGSANGAARVLGHTCQGIYQSLYRLADGHPVDGKYTSISTQYKFEARPAFVVEGDEPERAAVKS